jgi:hypothetical protein
MVNDEGSLRKLQKTCRVLNEVTNPIMWRMPAFRHTTPTRDILKEYDWQKFIETKSFKYCRSAIRNPIRCAIAVIATPLN